MKLEALVCQRIVYRFPVSAEAHDFAGSSVDVVFMAEDIPGTWCIALFDVKDGDAAVAHAGQRNVSVIPSVDAARGILWAWLSYREVSDGLFEKFGV